MNVREILGGRLTEDTTIEQLIEMLEADNSTVSIREYNAMKDKSDKNAREASNYRKQLNANKRENTVFLRTFGIFALTDQNFIVKVVKSATDGHATGDEIPTV